MHAHIYLWDLPSPYLFIFFSLAFYAKTRDESLLKIPASLSISPGYAVGNAGLG